MRSLLRLFGVCDEPAPMREYRCPTCGHVERWPVHGRDPVDAYLAGASIEWLEDAIERDLKATA